METITLIEAVRAATDPFGIDGTLTAACRPSAKEVIERLHRLGFRIERIGIPDYSMKPLNEGSLLDAIRERDPGYLLSELEMRYLDGDR